MSRPLSPRTVTQFYLASLCSLFLLFPGLRGYAAITAGKFVLLALLTAGYAALLLRSGRHSPRGLWSRLDAPRKCVLLYLLWSGLSTLFSLSPALSFWGGARREGLITLLLYGAVFFTGTLGRPTKALLWVFGVGVSLCCVLALFQLAGFNPLALYPRGLTWQDGNLRYAGQFLGTVGNVGLLSAVLCVAIPVFWVGLLRLEDRRRFLLLLPLGLSLSVLLLSRVEAGLVGVFGGALLTLPVVSPHRRRPLLLAVLALLAGLFLTVWFFGGQMGGFLYEAHEVLHGRWRDEFGSGRLYIWKNVLPLVPERLWLGGGPETLALRREILFERWDETLGLLLQSVADTAHNEYLHVLVCQGLPALLFYLGALGFACAGWIKHAPTDPAAAMLGAGVLGYCIQAFFGISSVVSAPFFWGALGLLVGNLPQNAKKQST